MEVAILCLVLAAVLFVVVSGVWVAVALVRAVSSRRNLSSDSVDKDTKA